MSSQGLSVSANLTNVFDLALTLFYPQACLICGASVETRCNGFVCENCWRKTKIFAGTETICWKCGRLMRGSVKESERENIRCGQCEDDFYDFSRSAGTYTNALRASVLKLKRTAFVPFRLSEILCQIFEFSSFSDATRIIPVPLSPTRLQERGFNQAELLAQSLVKKFRLPLDAKSLTRSVHTEKLRAGMDRIERQKSVENAFEVVRPRLIEGEKVLLIDDVLTSGATVSNCAKVLKEKGAAKVYVLAVAQGN